jgi:hypothetical protein
MPLEKAAHEYLDLGFSVMPIGDDKRPLERWEHLQEERPTHRKITYWWDRYPHANVGIITGPVSGIFVLDLDKPEAKAFVKDRCRGIPDTPIAATSKGVHIYFDYPSILLGNRSDNKIGMDIRGEGGYVVAPPSVHPTGIRYEWTIWHPWNTRIAKAPEWLLDWCQERSLSSEREVGWQNEILEGVQDGGRNNAAASLAGRFFNKDLSVPEITEILLMWNERNRPPLPEDEIIRTVSSMAARHRRNG